MRNMYRSLARCSTSPKSNSDASMAGCSVGSVLLLSICCWVQCPYWPTLTSQ
jgi:hypothetical protein